MFSLSVGLFAFVPGAAEEPAHDPRTDYDVLAYRLDLDLDPEARAIDGVVGIEARVVAPTLDALVFDAGDALELRAAAELGAALDALSAKANVALEFTRGERSVTVKLTRARKAGDVVRVALQWRGKPGAKDGFEGVHWKTTRDGKPWFSVACQGVGSSWWWPGKDSFWHPEDKPERTWIDATVPKGLFAVANGRLVGRAVDGERETFHWVHEYPCETYAITLDAAPYVVVEQKLALEGLEKPLTFAYYVLPENAEKAKLQFADVPRMLAIYGQAFGPFPFPKAKYALVETAFWGMEHSTAVAYGSSYPKWCAANDEPDRFADRNRAFDFILVHESAHEWWGNAVSAADWGHFWLHEGFATYAEAVYLEFLHGRAAADEYMEASRGQMGPSARLYKGAGKSSAAAYGVDLYTKGAWVLATLRHCVDDDEAWWRTLRAFQAEYRYRNATTEDFRAVLERETKKAWKRFFDELVYGEGYPMLEGTVRASENGLEIVIENTSSGATGFHVPVDLSWKAGAESGKRRLWLDPGRNELVIALKSKPRDVVLRGPEHILGKHAITIE
ncbi:MAG: M1 family metallopeptidase [Planctomycetes bacterium]|nr:M1 family metallopeptidase [Planctomycetota bacterium]